MNVSKRTTSALLLLATLGTVSPAAATTLTFEIFYTVISNPGCGPCFDDVGGTVLPALPPGYGYPEGYRAPNGYGDEVTMSEMQDLSPPSYAPGTGIFRYGETGEGFTPDITAHYGPYSLFTGGPELWREGYGDLDGVLYQGSRYSDPNDPVGTNYNILDIVLTAEALKGVVLYGFDVASALGDQVVNAVSVFDGVPFPFLTPTNFLYNSLNQPVSGTTRTPFDFGAGLVSPSIWIRIDASNLGDGSEFIGIDNIRFGQVVNLNNTSPLSPEEIDAAFRSSEVPEPASLALLLIGGVGVVAARARQRRRSDSAGVS